MPHEVNINEFYVPKPKQLVYKHDKCGNVWIQKGFSTRESSFCSICLRVVEEALAAHPTTAEAREHQKYLAITKDNEEAQIKLAKALNERISQIESQKPKEGKKYFKGVEVKQNFLDGSFYTKWLEWNDATWPNAEAVGCNTWKNRMATKSFGPRVDEKKPRCEVLTADLYKNISVWAQK